MKLSVTSRENGVIRLDCSGVITAFPAPEGLDMWLVALGPDGYTRTVLLDLSKADYLDSNGVSWLIIAHKHFVQAGGRLILHSLPRRLQDTVDLLRLPSILNIVADEAAARGLLSQVAP
jgi:anti-anti-sigma factor